MARTPPLPKTLGYLQPFRRKFARLKPESLNEDSGPPVLMPLLGKRIHGLSVEEAAARLDQDRASLEQWLAELGGQGDPLHFVQGFFLTSPAAELAAMIKEETEKPPEPKLCLYFAPPARAKVSYVAGGGESSKLVKLEGIWMGIDAVPNPPSEPPPELSSPDQVQPECTVTTVRFGAVTGRKSVTRKESWRGPHKTISYELTVPGGHVSAKIGPIGKKVDDANWDESPFEACFNTLRVEMSPPTKPSQ